MTNHLLQYYRCPEEYAQFISPSDPAGDSTYFCRYGQDIICYGACGKHPLVKSPAGALYDASEDVSVEAGRIYLPFDPSAIIDNLRCEGYVKDWRQDSALASIAEISDWLRPLLPISVRRHLQQTLSSRLEEDSVSAMARRHIRRQPVRAVAIVVDSIERRSSKFLLSGFGLRAPRVVPS